MRHRPRPASSRLLCLVAAGVVGLTSAALLGVSRAEAACTGCWSEQPTGLSSPGPRWAAAAAVDEARGVVIVFGGLSPNGLADTWEYTHNTWVQLHPQTSPPARGGAALAWDGHELVLFGGVPSYGSTHYLDDTWSWNGVTWSRQHPKDSPAPRTTTAAYDGTTAVLFGGAGNGPGYGGTFNDTWTWDNAHTTWVLRHVSPSPSSRGPAPMTYSSKLGGAILVGGMSAVSHNDAWLFRGGSWRQLSPDLGCGVPTPADGLASTSTGDLVQLTQGRSSEPSGTFAWDGHFWNRQQRTPAPSPRLGSVMVGAPGGGALLFGGQRSGTTSVPEGQALGDTWMWTGPATNAQPVGTTCKPSGTPPPNGGHDAIFTDDRDRHSPTPQPIPATATTHPTTGASGPGSVTGQPDPTSSPAEPVQLSPAPEVSGPQASGSTDRDHGPGAGLTLLAALLASGAGATWWRARRP